MLTDDSAPDDRAMFMPCDDQHPTFSFASCPHSSSHGIDCTTTQDAGPSTVYPSPPPTTSQPKRNVPLPATTHQFGGILDSPVVYMKATTSTPLSPPPTIPTPTHALPPSDAPDAPFSSLLLPIPEHTSPSPAQSQLLSPISPEWPSNRKPQDELFEGDPGQSVLLSQPFTGAYPDDAYMLPFLENEVGCMRPHARPLLPPLDIPMCSMDEDSNVPVTTGLFGLSPLTDDESMSSASSIDFLPSSTTSSSASPSSKFLLPCPHPPLNLDILPPSSGSSLRESDSMEPDYSSFGLGITASATPTWHHSPTLLSFASLPSPDLDDLDLDMDLGPGPCVYSSPPRRSFTSLPSVDESECGCDFMDTQEALDVSMSPPLSLTPHVNALCLDLPMARPSSKPPPPPSVLDAFTPAELAARVPPNRAQEELEALLAVRARAKATLAACTAAARPASCAPTVLDDELRRSVPRDAGEPRRRRKRAKELGREVDALVGLALGILPKPAEGTRCKRESAAGVESQSRPGVRRDKAGLAGLVSIPQLVARMILRRRERCVRGFDGSARARSHTVSPLVDWNLQEEGEEDGEPPPEAMEMEPIALA